MKKISVLLLASLSVMAVVSACNKEEAPESTTTPSGTVSITASMPEEGLSKVSLTQDGTNKKLVKLAWEGTDVITVNENEFHIDPDSITNDGHTAVFNGPAPEPKEGKYNISYSSLPGSFEAQTQYADGETKHLGYSVALTGANSYTNVSFTQAGATALGATLTESSVLRLRARLPEAIASAVKKVIFKSSANVFDGGKTLEVELTTPGTAGEDNTLDVYATLPAGDITLTEDMDLLVQFQVSNNANDKYTAYRQIASGTPFVKSGAAQYIGIDCSNIATYAGPDDNGTAAHPYLIGDKYQMAAIADNMSTIEKKYFKLIDDITLSSWSSIDCDAKGAIDFNGNGNTISGLNKPLFEFFDGKVSNLIIAGANITANGNYYGTLARTVTETKSCELSSVSVNNSSIQAKGTIGGLVGKIVSTSPCTLTNCTADVNLTGSGYYIGGLVGQVTNGTLTHCSATGDVSSSTHFASGFVGYVDGTVGIEECFATGDIKTTAEKIANLGGIVASTAATGKLTIKNCYYSGIIGTDEYNTRRWCGGILGTTNAGAEIGVSNCYASFSVKSASPTLDGALVGNNQSTAVKCSGFVGWSTISKMAGANNAVSAEGNYLGKEGTIYSQAVALTGWDFTNVWTTDATPQLRPYVAE